MSNTNTGGPAFPTTMPSNGITVTEVIAAWNKQADYMNSWQHLSEEEKLEWAMKLVREECALAQPAQDEDAAVRATHKVMAEFETEPDLAELEKIMLEVWQPVQSEQEPVAWMTINEYGEEDDIHYENPEGHLLEGWTYKPLYTSPPQRPWVDLTSHQLNEIFAATCSGEGAVNLAIAKFKENNK